MRRHAYTENLSGLPYGGGTTLVYTDGRPTKVAFRIEKADGTVIVQKVIPIPFSTNFEAEYRAVIEALKFLVEHKLPQSVVLFNDNATVIGQLLGKARVFEPRLKVLFDEATRYVANFPYYIQFMWIEKARNKAHDLFER